MVLSSKRPMMQDHITEPGYNDKPCLPMSIAKSNYNNIALYNDHLFMPLIALSDTIKSIVVLLITGVETTLFNKI
jgi:hypothetical protein